MNYYYVVNDVVKDELNDLFRKYIGRVYELILVFKNIFFRCRLFDAKLRQW